MSAPAELEPGVDRGRIRAHPFVRYGQGLTELNGAPHADLLPPFRYAPVLEAPDPEPQEDRRWTRTAP
jgi:hypothetical protein